VTWIVTSWPLLLINCAAIALSPPVLEPWGQYRSLSHFCEAPPRCSVAQHIRRANRLQALIAERFGIHEPYQYQAKHLRYALEHGTAGLAAVTRYDYWRTTRVIAAVLGKWPDWEPHLRGSWTSPRADRAGTPSIRPGQGGRPAKLARAHRRQAK
jgi:hypothetical protein